MNEDEMRKTVDLYQAGHLSVSRILEMIDPSSPILPLQRAITYRAVGWAILTVLFDSLAVYSVYLMAFSHGHRTIFLSVLFGVTFHVGVCLGGGCLGMFLEYLRLRREHTRQVESDLAAEVMET